MSATCLFGFGEGPAQAQMIVQTNGANGVSAGSDNSSPTSGTSSTQQATADWELPKGYSDSGYQTIWVLASSNGGNGGNAYQTGTDSDGVPQYASMTPGSAGDGDAAMVLFLASLTAYSGVQYTPSTSSGVKGVVAESIGGHPGQGKTGLPGGNGGGATVMSQGSVSLYMTWGAPELSQSIAMAAISKGGAGTDTNDPRYIIPGGDGGSAATAYINDSGGNILFDQSNAPSGESSQLTPLFGVPSLTNGPFSGGVNIIGAGVVASSWGGNGGAGSGTTNGGAGGDALGTSNNPAAYVGVYDADVSITSSGLAEDGSGTPAQLTPAIIGIARGGDGGDGAVSQDSGSNTTAAGGKGGSAGAVEVNVGSSDTSEMHTISTVALNSPAIAALAFGGSGGDGANYNNLNIVGSAGAGGAGGSAGKVDVSISDQTAIETALSQSPGIYAVSMGGAGGAGGIYGNGLSGDGGNGGAGGTGGSVTAELNAYSSSSTVSVETAGDNSPGLWALSQGGAGGVGGYAGAPGNAGGGSGGNGGASGNVQTIVSVGSSVATLGTRSPGMVAQTIAGAAGDGADASAIIGSPGGAGNGGSTGWVNAINAGTITTEGELSPGIVVQNQSGGGGTGGNSLMIFYAAGANGGSAGTVGDTKITNLGTITTSGDNSAGVIAQSLSGGGGIGGWGDGLISVGGDGGTGQNAGTIEASLSGRIETSGTNSAGVNLQSIGGGGGVATSLAYGGVTGVGGTGGVGGNGGAITVTASGTVSTSGEDSYGLLMQSIGGGGGSAGGGAGAVSVGGGGSASGTGGAVTATSSGTIATTGSRAHALVAQSVGGGGGAGGGTKIAVVSVGGSGSASGNGGAVTLDADGRISASGEGAYGVIGQSVGGGGGIGGSQEETDDTGAGGNANGLLAIGGSGSAGGTGGAVAINVGGTVTTSGDGGTGVLAQSVGGGGGIAGSANSISAEVGVAIGGSGGNGGNGGTATVTSSKGAVVVTSGSSSVGIMAQSVGKGGGAGGGGYSMVGGIAFGASLAVGGSGGGAGNGAAATVNLTGTTIITGLATEDATDPATEPDYSLLTPLPVDSAGVIAQSVGGGGGSGGSASAQAFVLDLPNPFDPKMSVGLSGSFAVGGSGGAAGSGGPATINISDGTNILTYGNSSFGVEAQSVGGGGGNGGDSSASSATYGLKDVGAVFGRKIYNVDLSYSNGGNAGGGGSGGTVNITLGGTDFVQDAAGAASSSVETLGDYAFAVVAQSVGGGGGNAGIGAGSTQNATSSSSAITLGLTVGATGSTGGTGGKVSVTQFNNTSITTFGDSAYGILAESIGGGGGTSAGGSFQTGLPSLNTVGAILDGSYGPSMAGNLVSKFNIKVGADGGAGGIGGNVSVTTSGQIATTGEAAFGILAQSVGGGGGVAGSAGSAASSDNPYLPTSVGEGLRDAKKLADNGLVSYLVNLKKAIGNDTSKWEALKAYLPSLNFNLSLGATGGSGGYGGTVDVNLEGATITTAGDHATAVVAQSVGGGGGVGGAAAAGGSQGIGNLLKLQFNAALGGEGGSGSYGGAVNIATGGTTISTQGFAAAGIMGQSIGGGGGLAGSAEFNASSLLSLGLVSDGDPSTGANGGTVTLSQYGDAATTITTTGDLAFGVVLQSIGGGGGIAEQGYTLDASTFGMPDGSVSANLTPKFVVGGSVGGNGGLVQTDADAKPLLYISTSGTAAFGFVAQSIGGGGGIAAQNVGTAGDYTVGGVIGNNTFANAGTVDIALADGSVIRTTGDGSIGIFAQSVGGGGGIAALPVGSASLSTLVQGDMASNTVSNGNGGGVTVDTGNSLILTTGASAHGIFAQSVGAGGGIMSSADGTTLIAGTTGGDGSNGSAGGVTVNQAGAVITTGANSNAIFVQESGQTDERNINYPIGGTMEINVDGLVSGGSGSGAGIRAITDNSVNTITIGADGFVRADSGTALLVTGYGYNYVYNSGTVEGSYALSTVLSNGSFQNQNGGTLIPQGTLKGDLINDGLIAPSTANAYAPIVVEGNFEQSATGVFRPNVHFATGEADRLEVTGDAVLAGTVAPVADAILPHRSLDILTVDGTVTGTLEAASSALFTYAVTSSIADGQRNYALEVESANFNPSAAGLGGLQQGVAGALKDIWDAGGGNISYGRLFAVLEALAERGWTGYGGALSQLAPQASGDFGASTLSDLLSFADGLSGCGSADAAVISRGSSCAWMRVRGGINHQAGSAGAAAFRLDTASYEMGGEAEIAPSWFLSGAGRYQGSWLSTSVTQSGTGEGGAAGLGLRHEAGPWSFGVSAYGSAGFYQTTRAFDLPDVLPVVTGAPDIYAGGVRASAAYRMEMAGFAVVPKIFLDGVYVNMPSYRERGWTLPALAVEGTDQATFVVTPALSVSKRLEIAPGMAFELALTGGVRLQTSDGWTTRALFADAPLGVAPFETTIAMDNATALVGLGAQIVSQGNVSLKAQYDGQFSQHVTSNTGALALSVRF